MKLTNNTMIKAIDFLRLFKDKYLPQKISYAIVKNSILLGKEYEEVYLVQVDAILEKARQEGMLLLDDKGEIIIDETTGFPMTNPENPKYKTELESRLTELLECEVTIDGFVTVDEKYFDYSDEKYDALTPNQLITLMDILK